VTSFPCRGLLRGLRQHDGHQGRLPWHSIMPSLVHMLDVLRTGEVAGRSPCPCVPQVDADAMAWLRSLHLPASRPTCAAAFGCRRHTSPTPSSAFRLLSRVGEGDISALGCGLTGSCSSTFQCFSLGDHLGVTASPQSPLPAGYVTLPVDDRSPPLGLMPPHSRVQGILDSLLSPLAFQSYAPRSIRDEAHRR
jgi:hypothetical protein